MASKRRPESISTASRRCPSSLRWRDSDRWSAAAAAFILCATLKSLDCRHGSPATSVYSFQIPPLNNNNRINNRIQSASLPIFGASPSATRRHLILRPHQKVDVSSHPSTSTTLQLFFDKFLHPYGVTNHTHNHDEEDDLDESQIELLNMLLPHIPTPEEKARILEGFQRARLDEQLRLSKLSKMNNNRGMGDAIAKSDQREGGGSPKDFLADDEEEVSKMTDLFQRARLAEQLRLSKLAPNNNNDTVAQQLEGVLEMGIFTNNDQDNNNVGMLFDKDEAFQRALLQERLKLRQLQKQRQHNFVTSSDSIEKAMMEYESEIESDGGDSTATLTMVQDENNEVDAIVANGVGGESAGDFVAVGGDSPSNDVFDLPGSSSNNNDSIGDVGDGENIVSVNQMGEIDLEDVKLKQLQEKLEGLHHMVDEATSSPPSRGSNSASSLEVSTSTTPKTSTSSLQNFLSTTYLPLPPREDASFLSLTLAPIAHFLSAIFLLGAGAFYAVMAILDVIWNDNQDEHSTRACLKEASSVVPKCLDYVFPYDDVKLTRKRGAVLRRTMRAMQTSCIASFYAVKCIFLRAAKYSRYANECMEAGTGALKYLVYAVRAASILWSRSFESFSVYYQNRRYSRSWNRRVGRIDSSSNVPAVERNNTWKRRLNPLRIVSKVTGSAARRVNRQRQLQAEQKLQASEEMYNKKLRLLNLDRVALERDRQELQDAQKKLEDERRQLLNEGVNVLAWYSAAMEAEKAAAAEGEERAGKEMDNHQSSKKKKSWNFWRGDKEKQ